MYEPTSEICRRGEGGEVLSRLVKSKNIKNFDFDFKICDRKSNKIQYYEKL